MLQSNQNFYEDKVETHIILSFQYLVSCYVYCIYVIELGVINGWYYNTPYNIIYRIFYNTKCEELHYVEELIYCTMYNVIVYCKLYNVLV